MHARFIAPVIGVLLCFPWPYYADSREQTKRLRQFVIGVAVYKVDDHGSRTLFGNKFHACTLEGHAMTLLSDPERLVEDAGGMKHSVHFPTKLVVAPQTTADGKIRVQADLKIERVNEASDERLPLARKKATKDFRPGNQWRNLMKCTDRESGNQYLARIRVTVVDPPNK